MSTVHITQITDLHLGANEQETLGGVTTFESFKAALQASDDQGRADNLLLLTGDLASDYQAGAYQLLNKTLTEKHARHFGCPAITIISRPWRPI